LALSLNTTGTNNSATGYRALSSSTTADGNTALGADALRNTTTGAFNTGVGVNALSANTTGIFNVAVGTAALQNATGNSNIGIGNSAGSFLTTGSNNIDIGNAGVAGESNSIRIGTAGTHSLTVIAGIRGATTGTADAIAVLIDSNGQLGTVSSSRRFKENIADMSDASSLLMKLRPVTFHYKSDQDAAGRRLQYGLIAEEVADVDAGLVARSPDGQVETVLYQFLPPMLLNEYQKQQRTIQSQAARIEALERQTAMLAAALERLAPVAAAAR
jgi:hypothetical protein